MDTSNEILQEAKVALTRIKEKEKQWVELKRLSPHRDNFVYFVVFVIIVLSASMIHYPGFSIRLVSIMFLLVPPFILISQEQKRDKLLLTIIEKEASEFYQKLKDKGIAY